MLATSKDDSALRAFLRENPVPGNIEVSFEREPDFFAGSAIRGELHQTILVRDTENGRIAGMGSRSISKAFVNGQPASIGYLSDLRIDCYYQRGPLLARGYRFLKGLHEDGKAQLYTTAIFSDNGRALETITTGRAGLPGYHPMGGLNCSGINFGRSKPPLPARCSIERGSLELLPQIVECLNRNNARKQFAPVHSCEDFLNGARWRDFRISDFYVAVDASRVIGVLGKWDQGGFKQTRIVRYSGGLRWLVCMAKVARPLLGGHRFPAEGEILQYFYVCFVAVDGDDPFVFRALLRTLYRDACAGEAQYGLISIHSTDPLSPALEEYSLTPFFALFFCVSYPDGEPAVAKLDGRVPYVEAATF
jgi:hypothetical protein